MNSRAQANPSDRFAEKMAVSMCSKVERDGVVRATRVYPMTRHGRTSATALAALSAVLALMAMHLTTGLTAPAAAQERAMQRVVTVSAEGSINARPDIAHIQSGVVTEAATAAAALSQNSMTMSHLTIGLKASGIADADIKTTSFNVAPRYVHARDGSAPTIDGYRVTNDVHVIVRNIAKVGDLLDRLVKLGANQIGGLSFDVANAEALKDEARKAAIANARRRAELYAAAAGASLGPVVTISEETVHVAPRGPMLARAAAAESVPISEGTQKIEARVTVSWELK